jgi:hypothetical protein
VTRGINMLQAFNRSRSTAAVPMQPRQLKIPPTKF